MVLITATAIIAMTVGIWFGKQSDISFGSQSPVKPEVIQGAIYPSAKIINDFALLNQHSNKVTKADFLNHWSLIFVGYTHCPDVCPTTLNVLNKVNEFMTAQKVQAPKIVLLTVDPQRDTPAVLKPYVEYFNKNILALTGDPAEIKALTQQLNAVYRKAKGASGDIEKDDYAMDHSSALMLINPNGNLQSILTPPHTPANIIDSVIKSQAYFESQYK